MEQAEHIQHLSIKFTVLHDYNSNIKKSLITGHHKKYSNNEKFEILWESPDCDREKQNE